MITAASMTVGDQIKNALDGRSQRWLSFEVRIAEQELSKKIKGILTWKPGELEKIEARLNFKIER